MIKSIMQLSLDSDDTQLFIFESHYLSLSHHSCLLIAFISHLEISSIPTGSGRLAFVARYNVFLMRTG